MTTVEIKMLARFFVMELAEDPLGVVEWLDNQPQFDNEEERDDFIENVKEIAK